MDDQPNTQARPMPAVVEIRKVTWARDLALFGRAATETRVVQAVDFYRNSHTESNGQAGRPNQLAGIR